MWLLLALFIVVKLLVFHKMQKMHLDVHTHKICPGGYHGLAPDPFDCDSYYLCPDLVHLFCPAGQQFDLAAQMCVDVNAPNGCVNKLRENLLL